MLGSDERKMHESTTDGSVLGTLADTLPILSTTQPVTEPEKQETADSLVEKPTLSHTLAMEHYDEEDALPLDHNKEVVDLGWNEPKEEVPSPLVGGMKNEDLWLLIRRFNKQLYHVKEIPNAVPGDLDLNVADDEEFSPDKLRATIERFYMTVVIGVLTAVKHIARLRSWREKRRTACFAAAYFLAWIFDLVVPLLATTMITLIVHPPSRGFLFPPAPIALVDSQSGGLQKPKAGVLGSETSATGAPENHKGEAVEQEASNFFNGFTAVVVTSATGKAPQASQSPTGEASDEAVPDPSSLAVATAEAKDVAAGGRTDAKHDKTKVPMETAIWGKMRPIMHAVTDISDTWERFGNALEPTAPFPQNAYKLRIAALIVPLLLSALFVNSYMVVKGLNFGIGFGFFGDPIISRALAFLNSRFPHWQKLLEVRNTILKGVPTNAQLTLTLLRIGEANKAPLPPPPRSKEIPPNEAIDVDGTNLQSTGDDAPLDATDDELRSAIEHDPHSAPHAGDSDNDSGKSGKKGKRGKRMLEFIKTSTKAAVHTAIGTDAARAKVGSHHARNRLGAVPPAHADFKSGPVEFKGRYKGGKGHVYITTKSTIPAVAFSTDSSAAEKLDRGREDEVSPQWSIAVGDIRELKKIGGYGWKAKIVIGWSLGREVADGLEITDRTGVTRRVTALPLRDELFNRLIAMGGQKWEAW